MAPSFARTDGVAASFPGTAFLDGFRGATRKLTRALNTSAFSDTDSHNPLDRCRVSTPWIGFTTAYKTRGDCQTQPKSYKTSHFVSWIVGWKIARICG